MTSFCSQNRNIKLNTLINNISVCKNTIYNFFIYMIEYTVAIRTLGRAGLKYQKLLDSLSKQTIRPTAINIYIAEGYPIPKETIGIERYIYVKKGMVSQRALTFTEIDTEYILFLDDDLSFPSDTVEKMFRLLFDNGADIISPDIFKNSERPFISRILMFLSGRMNARKNDDYWGYKVMRNSGYSYNIHPKKEVYWSQTNAGACFLCRKNDFLKIKFEEELWLDDMNYALGDDQVMFYKMYKKGLKILTWYTNNFVHLDGGENMQDDKKKQVIYADFRFKIVFWHRFIYSPERKKILIMWDILCMTYTLCFTLLISFFKLNFDILRIKWNAIHDAIIFLRSSKYQQIPLIK